MGTGNRLRTALAAGLCKLTRRVLRLTGKGGTTLPGRIALAVDGEILERPNSSDQFTLGKKEKLIGVYYINKGYPDFREVKILKQNSEYSIVSSNEFYGLQEYDYIVLHADSIRFNNY